MTPESSNEKIKLTPSEFRESAFILLFEMGFSNDTPENTLEASVAAFDHLADDRVIQLVKGITEKEAELIEIISRFSKTRHVSRISKVNLAILKLALYEMKYLDHIPDKVSINEAVELAKKYADKTDSSFINGILDNFLKEKNGESQNG
jgi:N utilization substance protein B